MRKDIDKEIEKFFKEAGLEERVAELLDRFTGSYMIYGEVTENLKEALRRSPDDLINMIWGSIHEKEPDGEAGREEKEEQLYRDIPEYLESRLYVLGVDKLEMLFKVMNNYPISTWEAAGALREFVPFGWVFSFVEDGKNTLAVMDEVRDVLETVKKPEVMEQISILFALRAATMTALELYGVCTTEQIWNIILASSEDGHGKKESREVEELLQEYLPCLEEQKELWLDGKYIISPCLETKREYRNLLKLQDGNYFVPDVSMIAEYANGKTMVENGEYKKVFRILNRELRDQGQTEEMLYEIAGYVTREDWGIPEIMDCLYDWDVEFGSEKSEGRFVAALGEWLHGIRRWSECGHSRKELGRENPELKYNVMYTNTDMMPRETEKKIYPNDPCPCGSGKKYKKCCGRK